MIKEETLKEAAVIRYGSDQYLWAKQRDGFVEGAKWQQERSYSEEEVIEIARKSRYAEFGIDDLEKWFEQFKKK